MAEKRRLSARERREPAAKRRASEAPSQSQSQATQPSSKRKASAAAVAPTPTPPPPPPEVVENLLPKKIKDGEGLPTLPSPQPETLSAKEYQSIAESAVLLASLERSKKKWLSDGILVRYWTKPKKTKREQIEGKNPPKETMSKVGPCNISVGPHLFDAMLYTVKDPNAPPPIQYTPPQRPMVHYGHPNNFQQYQPYPTPPQHARQHTPQNPPVHSASPQPAYQQGSHPLPPPHARTPNQPPPQRPSQSAPRPSPQNSQAQPSKPSPDPVIQMLATRAASDPDLKALMRVVASSKASQEQLRAFQAHIDELNAIIRAREQQQQQRQQQQQSHPPTPNQPQAPPRTPQQTPQTPQTPQPSPSSQRPPQPPQQPSQQQNQQQQKKPNMSSQQPAPPGPQEQPYPRVEVHVPKPTPSLASTPQNPTADAPNQPQTPLQKSNITSQVKQEPGAAAGQPTPAAEPTANVKQPSSTVRPMAPPQNQPTGARPGPPYPPYQQPPYQGHPPAIQSRPPQYGSPAPYYRPAPPPPSQRLNYKSVVFEFTSPLTPYGSSTSGHAGSGDRYMFPEHTILEWLPDGNTVLASFLLVRKVDPNTSFPIETASEVTNSRSKGKSASRSKKGDKSKDKDKNKEGEKLEKEKEKAESSAQPTSSQTAPATISDKPTPIEGEKPAGDQADQKAPSTTAQAQPDSDKPQSKDKAEDTTKASNLKEYYQPVTFRIHSPNPKVLEPLSRVVKPPDEVRKYMNEIMDRAERAPDGFLAFRLPREDAGEEQDAEDKKKGGTPVPASRSRLSRGRTVDDESDIENREELIEEEEVLKDYYGPPTGLVPMGL
ncbi:hypothetical protein ETB97_009611 [Aspergillus alliaceus]|uniref:SWR1-complex protein 3 domain-containing protein n=1 Tax=Petromyces alliaceus TaxID=209559 RepID=A0A8H6A6G2_PETAA|nr:hypothetical protein ETB97_009611 [Aspergillus burnettii]